MNNSKIYRRKGGQTMTKKEMKIIEFRGQAQCSITHHEYSDG